MLRSSLTTAGVLFLGASAFAQTNAANRAKPITGPIRDAGVYHLNTHTWTRNSPQAQIGADVIYCNTCPTGFYSPLSTDHYVDEGRVPSPSSPTNLNSRPGCAASYLVDGLQLGYCTDQTSATFGTYTVNFYQSNAVCATVIGVTPQGSVPLTGLPAATVLGVGVCWLVTIDLTGGPTFSMLSDGDSTFGGGTDTFGWEMFTTAPGTATGPIIAADPNVCTGYDGTRWDSVVNYAEDGTGMGTSDAFRIEGGTTAPNCYYFGGFPANPFASFHLRLFSDACGVQPPGTNFCIGDGVAPHTACPCANNSTTASESGCLNSFGVGSQLRGTGTASISGDTVVLSANGLPVSSVLFFQGTVQQNSGNGSLFGDGLRCAGGSVIRLATHAATGVAGAATSSYPAGAEPTVSVRGLIGAPGTRTYQAWYRNAAAFCTAAVFNLSNGYNIVWGP